MYKIEKYLLEHGFKLKRSYESGVIIYDDLDEENEYTTYVALFTHRDPPVWEITIHNPFGVTLGSYKDDYDKADMLETHQLLARDSVNYAFTTKEWLNKLENPWEVIEDGETK